MLSLTCYRCYSTESWRDCDKSRVAVTCAAGQDRCGYVRAVTAQGIYGRDCETQAKCRTLCTDPKYKTCTAKCCRVDLCNGKRLTAKTTLTPTTVTKSRTPRTTPQATSNGSSRAQAHSCYSCQSRHSWDDCDSTMRAVTCPVAMDTCVKLSTSGMLYKRTCGSHARCRAARDNCQRARRLSEDFDCDVTCCSGRLCNSSRGLGTSILTNLLFGSVVALAAVIA